MIPGYTGYQDKERRREADKELRMFLARRFREQHAALARTQQQLARSRHLEAIGEVDRLGGVLQRFIDKLETASQGYAGLFDPVKVQEPELDQLYTFDAALTSQLQQVTDDVAAIGAAAQQGSGPAPATTAGAAPDLPTALSKLSTTLDALLQTWNHRNEVIMSGRPMPEADFNKFRANAGVAGAGGAPPGAPGGYPPQTGGQPGGYPPQPGAQAPGGQPYGGQPGGAARRPTAGRRAASRAARPIRGRRDPRGRSPISRPRAAAGRNRAALPALCRRPALRAVLGGRRRRRGHRQAPAAGQRAGRRPPEAATRRLDPSTAPPAAAGDSPSDVTGPPTGGPTGEQH